MTLHQVAFWLSITFLIIGAILALVGVWVREFWKSDTGGKLILTDIVLFCASLAGAAITKWLG